MLSQVRRRADPERERGLVDNAGALMAGRLVRAALGWGGTVLVVRSLSVDEFGRFTLIFTVLGLMSVVTDLGIGRIAVRGMLVDPAGRPGDFAGTYVVLRAVLGGFGYAVAIAVVVALGSPRDVVLATACAGVVILLATPSRALDVVFQARLSMGTVGAADATGMLAQFALTAAIAAGGGSLLLFTLPAVIAELVGLVYKARIAHRWVHLRLHVDAALWRSLLREAVPLSIGFGLATVYYRVDALLLSHLVGYDAVGIYGVSYKFIDVMHFASTAVTAPLLTLLVRSWSHDLVAFWAHLRRAAMLLGLLGGAAVTLLLAFAGPLTQALYGAPYASGEGATRLLAVAELVGFGIALVMVALVATGRHRHYPVVMLLGLLVNVLLNVWLVPRLSYVGAGLATLVSHVLVLALLTMLLRSVLSDQAARPAWRLGRLAALPVGVLAGVLAGLGADQWVVWPLAAAVAVVVYAAVTTGLGLTHESGLVPARDNVLKAGG